MNDLTVQATAENVARSKMLEDNQATA